MNANRLGKRWHRTLRDALRRIHKLHSRPTLNANSVHALRVALRRARLLLLLGRPLLKQSQARDFRRHARQLLDALGPVRDCDVALEWLPRNAAARATRRQLRQVRLRHWQAARLRLQQRLPALRMPAKASAGIPTRRWERLHAEARLCGEALIRRPASLNGPALHELRRQLRRQRYLLELISHRHVPVENARVRGLVDLQETLGAAQNLAVIAAALAESPAVAETRRWLDRAVKAQRVAHRRALRALLRLPCCPPATRGSAANRR